jgi:hypothetical protein
LDTCSRAWVAASALERSASLAASSRIDRASSSAWRVISADVFSAASTIARTCSEAAVASVSAPRGERSIWASWSAIRRRCASTASGSYPRRAIGKSLRSMS